ncbi:unnamed protein product, partial [Symbiodinium microadriaticum]
VTFPPHPVDQARLPARQGLSSHGQRLARLALARRRIPTNRRAPIVEVTSPVPKWTNEGALRPRLPAGKQATPLRVAMALRSRVPLVLQLAAASSAQAQAGLLPLRGLSRCPRRGQNCEES